MFCSFIDTANYGSKCVHSGSIIRKQIFEGKRPQNIELDSSKKTVLIMGGSLGAASLNKAVFDIHKNLLQKFNIIHICGKGKMNKDITLRGYNQIEFTNKIEDIFSVSDFVVSRAGSGSIFEFLALKKPMLLIPLPKKASRGDQILNAQNFKKHGYARVLFEEDITSQKLLSEINALADFKFPSSLNSKPGNELVLKELYKYSK